MHRREAARKAASRRQTPLAYRAIALFVRLAVLILAFLHDRIHSLRFQQAKRRVLRASRWDRLSRAERHRVAVRSGISANLADAWAKIRFRDLPEGWRERLLENCR